MAVVFTVIALLLHWRGRSEPLPYLFAAAGFFLGAAIIAPYILAPLYHIWMKFAAGLGWVNTRILLSIFFFIVITPMALLMRLFGRDALQKKFSQKRDSYWVKRQKKEITPQRYERQF